jgi:hypothetical protein
MCKKLVWQETTYLPMEEKEFNALPFERTDLDTVIQANKMVYGWVSHSVLFCPSFYKNAILKKLDAEEALTEQA